MKPFFALTFVVMFSGCATSLYQWGGYEQGLYAGYKDATKMEDLRIKLEAHISAQTSAGRKVGPGLYAELGTLSLQKGDIDKAIINYGKERDAWPESKALMTTMIQNLEKRKNNKEKVGASK